MTDETRELLLRQWIETNRLLRIIAEAMEKQAANGYVPVVMKHGMGGR